MSSTHDAQTVTLDPTTAQFDEQQTVADLFKQRGYVTGAVGKWHLGLAELCSYELLEPAACMVKLYGDFFRK